MSRKTAILLRILALTPLAAGVFACKAFDLDAETAAAQAANAAEPGYPRLADVPPEPADIECIRAGVAESLIVTEAPPDAAPGGPFAQEDGGAFNSASTRMTYQAVAAPPPGTAAPRYDNLLSAVESLADDALGDSGEEAAAPAGAQLVDCPPGPGIEATRLADERARLERIAAEIRAQRPVAPEPVARPAGAPPASASGGQ